MIMPTQSCLNAKDLAHIIMPTLYLSKCKGSGPHLPHNNAHTVKTSLNAKDLDHNYLSKYKGCGPITCLNAKDLVHISHMIMPTQYISDVAV